MAREDTARRTVTGADAMVEALFEHGIELCITNPGTSEMHLVAALDRIAGLRCVLGLAETVVTGAADGYARLAGKPAVTLLHTGPGLANGLANLHNARRAPAPIVNIIGDHASYHLGFDTPLVSDVAKFAAPVSHWVRTVKQDDSPYDAVADAIAAARGGAGRIATLIVPADVSWAAPAERTQSREDRQAAREQPAPDVASAVEALRSGEPAMLLLGGNIDEVLLEKAAGIAAATGARLAAETFPTRLAAGAGRPRIERLPYLPEMLHGAMAGVRQLVIAGAHRPATFFAYPGIESDAVPAGCTAHVIAGADDPIGPSLEALAAELGTAEPRRNSRNAPSSQTGALDPFVLAQAVASTLPDQAVLVDEAITGGMALYPVLLTAAPHDWLFQTGGAIGWGLPAAVGAALAAPTRKILCVEGDGSALYSIPALWTMAREQLDITVLIIANRSYAILKHEYARVQPDGPGSVAEALMSIGNPDVDFVSLAKGFGVEAVQVATGEALGAALEAAFSTPGPHLIEAVMPPLDIEALTR